MNWLCLRDSFEWIIKKDEKNIGETTVLVNEMFTIWHVLRQTIQDNYSKVLIKSDSLKAIQAIDRKSIPQHIFNLVKDINILVMKIENIKFVYCRRTTNVLTDRIFKEISYA